MSNCQLVVLLFIHLSVASVWAQDARRVSAGGGMEEEAALRECESYIASHDVQRLLKECIVQLCVHKPDNPVIFLRQHFQQLERPLGLGLRPINFGGRRTPLPTPADRYRQRKTIPPAPPAHSQLALDAPHRDHRAAPSTLSPPPD